MTLNSPRNVTIENTGPSFGDTLGNIRTWLDHYKIQPVEFKTLSREGENLALELRFQREDEAVLFNRAFT